MTPTSMSKMTWNVVMGRSLLGDALEDEPLAGRSVRRGRSPPRPGDDHGVRHRRVPGDGRGLLDLMVRPDHCGDTDVLEHGKPWHPRAGGAGRHADDLELRGPRLVGDSCGGRGRAEAAHAGAGYAAEA